MRFAETFTNLLEKSGITPYRMSKKTGIPEATIGRWKNGKAIPNCEALCKIANYFNVSTDYLLGNEQNKKSNTIGYELGPKEKAVLERLNKIKALSEEDYELAIAQLDLIIKRREDKNNK